MPDLKAAIRRVKPNKQLRQLRSGQPDILRDAWDIPHDVRPKILLDTNVYILRFAGELGAGAKGLLHRSALYHCSVCLAEIAVGIARRDVTDRRWDKERKVLERAFDEIPSARVRTPDVDVWIEAGVVAGTLARLQGYGKAQHRAALNDALIYLTARKAGLPVLTENRQDFEYLKQLAPGGTVYLVPPRS